MTAAQKTYDKVSYLFKIFSKFGEKTVTAFQSMIETS